MISRLLFILVLNLIVIKSLLAQSNRENHFSAIMDGYTASLDDDRSYDDLFDMLYQRYLKPINLNQTNRDELMALKFLTLQQVDELMSYIDNNRPILSVYELQNLSNFDDNTLSMAKAIFVVNNNDKSMSGTFLERLAKEENNYAIFRWQRTFTNDPAEYSPPYKLFGKFKIKRDNDFSLGMTFENDVGETFSWLPDQNKYGFDHISFHVFLESRKTFKKIAIGDYQLSFGQGLVFGAGFFPGKGSQVITSLHKNSRGLTPFSSVLESGFMRGIACSYQYKNFSFTPFVSSLLQDATSETDDEGNTSLSSIFNSGLHRSESELARKNAVREISSGINIEYKSSTIRNLKIGYNLLYTHYDIPLMKPQSLREIYDYYGNENSNMSLYGAYNFNNIYLFAEMARSSSGGKAIVAGLMSSLSKDISLSFGIRNYDADYHGFYAQSFGENHVTSNEKGYYWGIKYKPKRKYAISAFYDLFYIPWLKFQVNQPSQGYEYLLRFDYSFTRHTKVYFQFREEQKQINQASDNQYFRSMIDQKRRVIISNLEVKLNDEWSTKSRLQYSNVSQNVRTKGFSVYQDLMWKHKRIKMSGRFALFDTDDYDNRHYHYERDVLYTSSIPAYYGVGSRYYLVLQYKFNDHFTFWTKYGKYNYRSPHALDEEGLFVENDRKSELKIQCRYVF